MTARGGVAKGLGVGVRKSEGRRQGGEGDQPLRALPLFVSLPWQRGEIPPGPQYSSCRARRKARARSRPSPAATDQRVSESGSGTGVRVGTPVGPPPRRGPPRPDAGSDVGGGRGRAQS